MGIEVLDQIFPFELLFYFIIFYTNYLTKQGKKIR